MIDRPTEVELTRCDTEPIHTPGRIQSFGMLLVCDAEWRVTHCSENLTAMGLAPQRTIGRYLKDLIGSEAFHACANATAATGSPGVPGRVFGIEIQPGRHFDVALHEHETAIFVELEPVVVNYKEGLALFVVRSMMSQMQGANTAGAACQTAATQLRRLIDFDRVMIYRFLDDGSGTVVAECRADEEPSYLGHHYPASDIPRQARQLYLKNWLRLIADVNSEPVPILSSAGRLSQDLDLTYCALRAVSPIHIEYLTNMEVGASLSISVVVGGRLWGLIACHHRRPKIVPPDIRVAAEFFGQAFSMQLQTLVRADVSEMLRQARSGLDQVLSRVSHSVPLADSLEPSFAELASILACDGVGVWSDGQWRSWGLVPPSEAMGPLADYLGAVSKDAIFATDHLSGGHPPAAAYADRASGLLAIPLSRAPGDFLVLFRGEVVQTVNWAGDPNKSVITESVAKRLSPRKSFEIWREEVKHHCQPWEQHQMLTAEVLRISLLEVGLKLSEHVARERARVAEQQRVYAAEFSHRVKNALALVAALVVQSRQENRSVQDFAADLEARIHSLAQAHDLAGQPTEMLLHELCVTELDAFTTGAVPRTVIKGADVRLRGQSLSVMALVLHELTTNAVKHGALSSPAGGLSVTWDVAADGSCTIEWVESGGPPVAADIQPGFGTTLITRQIPHELGGRTELDFERSGLRATIWLPAECLGDHAGLTRKEAEPVSDVQRDRPLDGLIALVVDDSFIVSLQLERALMFLGAAHVVVAGTRRQALAIIDEAHLDIVLLDINLSGEPSYAVADELVARKIPFVFVSGYGRDARPPERFAHVPVLAKPVPAHRLAEAIVRSIREGRGDDRPS
jgi:light-regulated signal transduction histidine kinase (bacteriophytochrome)